MTRTKILLLLTGLVLTFSLSSCLKNYIRQSEEEETAAIQNYLNNNPSLLFELKSSGLYYLEVTSGSGLQPASHDTAYVFYTTKLLDGTIIDTNEGTTDTLSFPVNSGYVISGFDEGVAYMKEGGKSILLIPSSLAYGSTGDYYGNISGFTPLLFTVKLITVVKGPQ
ncbi:MAG: FKBP-type peptidyl-prolyl cis-trans isomerase [Bacteroidetes bacterium]|nr:FKBP-type peptidyl-prolyl cis-trans isomerase [Bacteroidota bacterium]